MTVTAYARHRKVDREAIRKYIAEGKIDLESFETCPKTKKLLIDPVKADADLSARLDPAKALGRKPEMVDPSPNRETAHRFLSSKADTETLKARKLELEIEEREGKLLDADEVKKRIHKIVGETKEKILNVAAKIAPELVSVRDVIEIENKITQELTSALENLSRLV